MGVRYHTSKKLKPLLIAGFLRKATPKVLDNAKTLGILGIFDIYLLIELHSMMMLYIIKYIIINLCIRIIRLYIVIVTFFPIFVIIFKTNYFDNIF